MFPLSRISYKIQVHDVCDILVLNAHTKIQKTKQNTNNFQHVTTPPLMQKRLQLGVEPRGVGRGEGRGERGGGGEGRGEGDLGHYQTQNKHKFSRRSLRSLKYKSLDSKRMQMNYRSSVFAELDRRRHSGSSRLRQIILTNLRKAYLLHRTLRNIGIFFFKSNQIYRAFIFDVSGSFIYAFSSPALSCGLAGISAFQRLSTSSCILGTSVPR